MRKASVAKRQREADQRLRREAHLKGNSTVRLTHEDKALGPEGTKLSPAGEAALDRRLAEAPITPDEANEIGRRVARSWEESADRRDPARDRMRAAAVPTTDEQAKFDAAIAAWEPTKAAMEAARSAAVEAGKDVDSAGVSMEAYLGSPDPARQRQYADAQVAARRASNEFDIACAIEATAEARVRRARAAIIGNGVARQRAVLWAQQR